MSKDFPVTGLNELDRYLSTFPKNLQKGAYSTGLTAAGNVIRDEARLRAPRRTGAMARAIRTGRPRQNQDGTFSVQVRLTGNNHAYLGLFHEYGVSPHLTARTGAGEGRRWLARASVSTGKVSTGVMKIGEDFVSGIISHPGHAAHPFMRPALDTKAKEAVLAFRNRIAAYIEGKTGFAAPLDEAA